jgi:hypothetical protein
MEKLSVLLAVIAERTDFQDRGFEQLAAILRLQYPLHAPCGPP